MAEREPRDMVLVMGLTGTGKSYFINKLTGASVAEGKSLRSCTSTCKGIATTIGNTDVIVIDCPGFDDTVRSDTDILEEITKLLAAQYILGFQLKGVVYLHRITDNKMQGSNMKNLQLFTKLIGEAALSNVVLVTTMWGKVDPKSEGEANNRDSELREEYWGDMIRKGSSATRFDGSKESAEGIMLQLLGKKSVVLEVQKELVDQKMPLNQTTAGIFLEPTVHRQEAEFEARVQQLKQELESEKNRAKRMAVEKSKDKAQAGKDQRSHDRETLKSKPGEEVEGKLKKLKIGGIETWKTALQALAAVVSISFTIAGALGVAFL